MLTWASNVPRRQARREHCASAGHCADRGRLARARLRVGLVLVAVAVLATAPEADREEDDARDRYDPDNEQERIGHAAIMPHGAGLRYLTDSLRCAERSSRGQIRASSRPVSWRDSLKQLTAPPRASVPLPVSTAAHLPPVTRFRDPDLPYEDLIMCERDCMRCTYAATLNCDGNCGVCPRQTYCPCVNPAKVRAKGNRLAEMAELPMVVSIGRN